MKLEGLIADNGVPMGLMVGKPMHSVEGTIIGEVVSVTAGEGPYVKATLRIDDNVPIHPTLSGTTSVPSVGFSLREAVFDEIANTYNLSRDFVKAAYEQETKPVDDFWQFKEVDKDATDAKLRSLGLNPDTFYNLTLGAGPFLGDLPKVNVIFDDYDWSPGSNFQLIGRLNRKPLPPPEIVRVGRYYTLAKIAGKQLPRSLKIRTRRLAKKFFKAPFIVNHNHWNIFDEGK